MVATNIQVNVVDRTANALGKISGRLKGLNQGLLGVNRVAALATTAVAAIGGTSVIRNIVATTTRFEDLRSTLTAVTGSAQAGADAFNFITDFSTKTQFGVEELTQTFIKLKAAGIEPTEELLTTFTDTAAITSDQIGSLEAVTDLFARTVSGGLGLEEIQRLGDRGVPVLAILEEKLGLTRQQISEFGKTAEGAKTIVDAFAEGINERFGGATEGLLNNTSVAFSNLQIEIAKAQDQIGSAGFGKALGDTANELTAFIAKNQEAIQSVGVNLTKAFLFVKESIILVAQNLDLLAKAFAVFFGLKIAVGISAIALAFASKFTRAVLLATKALKALALVTARHPLIAGALVVAIGINKLTGVFDKLAESVIGLGDKALGKLGEEMETVNGFIAENIDGFTEYKNEIDKIFRGNTGVFTGQGAALAAGMAGAELAAKNTSEAVDDTAESTKKATKEVIKFEGSFKDAFGIANEGAIKTIENFNELEAITDLGTQAITTFRTATANAFADALLGAKSFGEALKEVSEILVRQLIVGITELAIQIFILDKFVKPFLEGIANGTKNTTNEQNKLNRALGVELGLRAALSFFTGGASNVIPSFRADGGPVTAGRPYIVGEQGPEMFVPSASGRIVPNNSLGQAQMSPADANQDVIINFNITATDAASFDDLLVSRRSTIVGIINEGMNRQGKRSLI